MHPPRRRLTMSAVIAACLLTGCQAPAPTPAPVPTYTCTPEAGGAEFECTQHQYDEMLAKDKLYAEAEAVYRKFLEEDMRIARAGGVSDPTPVLLETTSGFFLEDSMAGYRSDKEEMLTVREGDRTIVSLTRMVGASKGGSIVALRACTDARTVRVFKRGAYFGTGLLTEDDLYFGRFGSQLKIIGADGKEVESCASG